MPGTNRSIGGRGNEQGGPNMGNDISRNISREVQADDTPAEVVKNKDKKDKNKKAQNSKTEGGQNYTQQDRENEDEPGQ
jgi:hypothetical protein